MKTEIKGASPLIMPVVFISFLFLLLFFVVEQQVLPGDTAWFMSAGRRIFLGLADAGDFWDTNPPYNFLFYLPLAAIAEGLKFSSYFVVTAFHVGIVLLNAAVIFRLFSERYFKTSEMKWPVTGAYVTASLLFFLAGHKDSLIAVSLLAMTIFQYAIHCRIRAGAIVVIASVFNAFIIFLKPYFLIVPATLIVCRLVKEKNFRTLLEYDCLVFLGLGLLYAAITLFFFPEFVFQKIKIIAGLYATVPYNVASLVKLTLASLFLNLIFFSAAYLFRKTEAGKLALYLACVSPLAIIVFYLQAKGFWEHALPAYTFLGMTAFLTVFQGMHARSRLFCCFFIVSCAVSISFFRPFPAFKTEGLEELQAFISAKAGKKNYFIESSTTTLPYLMELDLGNSQASYFPSMWMISGFISQGFKEESECTEVCSVFSNTLLDGLKKYDPYLLLLYEDDFFIDSINLPRVGVRAFLKNNKNFQEFLSAYTKIGTEISILYEGKKEERLVVYIKKNTD